MSEQHVNVVSYRSGTQERAFAIGDDPADVGVQFVTDQILQKGFAILGREDGVNQNLRDRLRHGG